MTDHSLIPAEGFLPTGNSPPEIRTRVRKLRAMMEEAYIIVARDLWEIYHSKHYLKWGYETWGDYLRTEVGISKDSAYRARRIFETFVHKCNLPPSAVEGIGRSKAQKLLPIVTRSNARSWISKAKVMTYDDLVDAIEDAKDDSGGYPTPSDPDVALPSSPITINVGKKTSTPKKPKVVKFRVRKFRLPDDTDDLLEESLNEAQRITGSHAAGFNLGCIAQFFLSHRLTSEGKNDHRLPWHFRQWEKIYGGRMIHVKDDKGWALLEEAIKQNPDHLGSSLEEIRDDYRDGSEDGGDRDGDPTRGDSDEDSFDFSSREADAEF